MTSSKVERVVFQVNDEQVVGHLHSPYQDRPTPAVIVAGPMTSVKEQVTGVYAAALSKRGIAALAIDHRHYGESAGQPRQYEHHGHKLEDLKAAISYLHSRSDIYPGRLGAVGICLGAGYAASLVISEPRINAFVAVAGYYRDPDEMASRDPMGFNAKIEQGLEARQLYERSGEVITIPAASLSGDAAMQTADTVDYYTRRALHPNYKNRFALMSREHFLPFNVQALAQHVEVPTLLIHAETALSPTWAKRMYAKLVCEKSERWIEAPSHTAFYDSPDLIGTVCDDTVQYLQKVWRN